MPKRLTQISFEFSQDDEKAIQVAEPTIHTEINLAEKNPLTAVKRDPNKTSQRKSTRGRMSLKEVGLNADLIQVPPDEILFQKQYYSIGEVAGWFKVNQSLIRYWETEFDILEPRKNRKGDRFFRPVDVKNLLLIHDLLRRRKYTIEGAREFLKKSRKSEEKFAAITSLEKIKTFLNELKANL